MQTTAKILAHGEWTDMCTRRSNLEKYGFMKSSKSERKEIKRKCVSDESDDEDKTRSKKKVSKSKKHTQSVEVKNKNKLWMQLKNDKQFERKITISDDENDDNSSEMTAKLQAKVVTLEKEIERLKNDNKRLRTLKTINEDLSVIDSQIKNIMSNLTQILKKTAHTNEDFNEQIIQNESQELETPAIGNNVSSIEEDVVERKKENVVKHEKENVVKHEEENVMREEPIHFHIKKEILDKCNHSSIAKLTGDLNSAIFSRKELATSSLTGKVANIHKNKNTSAAKENEKLSPRRVDAIMSYVQSTFTRSEDTVKEIQRAIRRKCNNTRMQ
ncbi:interaptin-like isoform X1 [Solenopsis invicta]|uniref:interaptin-like isoform X1 n=2 Tax=Solenopsis invicta TaxID=13686 RepID=UPI00193D97C9|nr:interaptin-like isoform X1 [Solenopsis invicta]